jgi:hypothetical protein
MAATVSDETGRPLEIDMDRVVADAEYRRRVIHRLRQERLLAEAARLRGRDDFEMAFGEED